MTLWAGCSHSACATSSSASAISPPSTSSTLEVPEGTCVGLLGPNGAGKSTTMRLLTAQAIPDEGEIEILGLPVPERSKEARALCGVVPQLDNLDITLTVEQNLRVFAHLYRVPRNDRKPAVERALEIANLKDRRDTKVDNLSGGMRRRLLIARGLVHQPKLILLDEPTVGLDPQVRQELWALIDRLRSEGVSILMSTHYIEEAERLADTRDDHVPRPGGRHRLAARADRRARRAGGGRGLRAAGAACRRSSARRQSAGYRTRRTGTSISILNANGHEGERRPTNLEDVFVLLTGEEIA